MLCSCGSTLCDCQDICLCHPDTCNCWHCDILRRSETNQFSDRCATKHQASSTALQQAEAPDHQLVVHPSTPTGRYPDLGFLNQRLQLDGESDARNDAGSPVPQDTPEQRESPTDDLIFQIDYLPAKTKPKKNPACLQIMSKVTGSNSRQPQVRENTTAKKNCAYSKLKQRSTSKLEESQVTETQIKNLPAYSSISPVPTFSEPEKSKLTEMPNNGDLPASSKLYLDATVSKPEESEDVSISSSNMYSSESLPSELSNDSTTSHNSTCSLSHTVSTAPPSIVDLQKTFKETGSSMEKSDTQSSSETSPTFLTLNLKELSIRYCPTERKLSVSSSSVETLSTDFLPETSTTGQNYEFPSIPSLCISNVSPIQATTMEHKTSQKLALSSRKLSSQRTSKLTREKTISESSSSIETLNIESLTEEESLSTSPKESPSTSPKKDDLLKK